MTGIHALALRQPDAAACFEASGTFSAAAERRFGIAQLRCAQERCG